MSTAAPLLVIAPDSLKGSCSSPAAAAAIAAGVRSVFGDAMRIAELPMADGGEGTLEALVAVWDGDVAEVATTDALGRERIGRVGFGTPPVRDGSAARPAPRCAIIEAADANGLPAVSDLPLRALDADSAGVGALVRAALDAGADEILLCLGGSATSDGGAGMLRALGARLLDARGNDVAPGARGLAELDRIDLAGLDPRASRVGWRIACDVENPLVGPLGAAAVFGPQKGADPSEVAAIDAGLARLAERLSDAVVAERAAPSDGAAEAELQDRAGLGAAGGLALGPVALFGAELVPGAVLVSEAIGLRAALDGAALAITGEGRLDSQSLGGKVVSQVLAEAGAETPVFVIAGSLGLSAAECREAGIAAAFSVARGPAELAELQEDAARLLEEAAAQLSGVLAARLPGRPAAPRQAAVAASELAAITSRISAALPGQPNEP